MKQQQKSDLTAIIGMACRLPGAEDYNQFWKNMEAGVNSISEIPRQRWKVEKHYSTIPNQPNKTISKWGGLVEGIDEFDAEFFSISPREAGKVDPQHRIMLELSWSCIEDAGYSPSQLSGKDVGVFMGACNYDSILLMNQNQDNVEGHSGTGTWTCMIPNRISSFFNLHGPSIPIDTACSSSLVAIHYALKSLKESECEMALVGGISVLFTSTTYIQMSQLGMLSPTGQCRTFSSDADGYVRGEGAGVVLLKPLTKAIEDGDRIYGVIQGSAINHGGKARTITSPNVYAQGQVIRSAYNNANIYPNTVSYIESHGTGTPLGDPIEINALKRAYRQLYHQYGVEKTDKPYCGIGAVKSNIGHLEGAAGIAGLIKVLLAMKYKKLPKIVNFKELNPRINIKDTPFYFIEETQEWKRLKNESGEEIPRRAGLSSFGIGGVNAHIVLEEPPEEIKSEDALERPLQIFTLSAQTEKALRELATKYQTYLESKTETSLQDICFSANTGRTHFAEKLAIVAESNRNLQEKLADFLQDNQTNGVVIGKAETEEKEIAFLFTGQGSQYVDMGRKLYETQPTFQKVLDQCNEILKEYLEVPLLEVIYPKDAQKSSILDQTAYTQPALFAIEYALAKLWESWGIKPNVVMGHSVGEYVAATIAGVFSLEDGLKLIAMRGRLMQQLPPAGEMVSLMASESQVIEAIKDYSSQVTIAAINGPESIVISGESEAIATICSKLESQGVKTKKLQVSHAFHSPLMEPMLAEFEAVAQEVTYSQPQIPVISNVTGQKVGEEITTAKYWVDHVRQPVKFAQSMKILHEEGYEVFLEIGPKPILLGMGRQCLPEDVGVWLPSLRPGVEEWQQMLSSLGQLYIKGFNVDWLGFDQDYTNQKVELPTYPFQRERYWIDTASENQEKDTTNQSNSVLKLLDRVDTEELIQELKLSEELTEDEQKLLPKLLNILTAWNQKNLQNQDYIVGDFYDELASFMDEEAILNYIPLPGIVKGFSWVLFAKLKTKGKYQKLASTAQQEIRNIAWQKVDFSSFQKVLDIGCGHGTDLMALGQKYNHLELCGYTISDRQVELGNKKINQLNLEDRAKIVNGDSSQDEFPDNYDLIYGFEVICHIKKKQELFLNIRNHLNNEGNFVMSDFISNASFNIDYDAHSSYLITQQEWLHLLSESHLKIIQYVDISKEIGNGLHDPNFPENLNYVCKKSNLNENARVGLQSYDNLYKMLRKQLVSYVVMTAQKQEQLSVDEIYKWNQEILQKPLHYSDVSLQKLFYGVEWQKARPRQQQKKQLQSKNWIIFSDRDGVGEKLKNLLEKRGDRCLMVFRGETYKQKETGTWELNPSSPADFDSFCQDAKVTVGESLKIIHLWSLETTASQQLTQSALESAQKYSCGSVLHLVQAIEKHWNLNSPSSQLWLITKGSQSVLPHVEEVAIAQTPLWGIGKVISLEHPELWGGLLDLDRESSTNENEAEILLQLLEEDQEEDKLAIRNGEIYVARLERKLLAESQQLSFSESGSYLITGGTGSLGLSIAQWLVEKGCKRLVLTGRSQPSEQAKLKINSLEKQGTEVVVTQADVSVQEDMERVFKQLEEAMPPLKGVIHAAGVIGFHLLQELELSQLEAILCPKVLGGWLLHQLTQKLELDFFVNFSSIASVWGSKGQAHYAAANNFLDGLTYYRQSMGLPTYSINWGPWSGGGMATGEAMNWLNKMGVQPLDPEKAIAALEKVLASNNPQTVVADINWDLFKELYELGGKGSFLEEISLDSEATDGESISGRSSKFLQQLHQAPESERNQILIEHLQTDVAKIIGLSKSKLPDPELGFFKMGMDSLMAVELRNLLSSTFSSSISTATLFEKSNIKDLAEYLIEEIFLEEAEQEIDVQDSQQITPPKQIETEFEGEIDSAIASELQEIQALLKEED